ncbi:hypothetical protein DOY81_000120 [Sarcophaga bullata]|nr:hypothetical protein DOY81_000120 [Sarcophaga bullata]
MNAVSVYVNTAKLVLQSTETSSATAASSNPELSRLLLCLRQLLSCVVCNRLVSDPYAPQSSQCTHNVCRLCVRGPKNLHPACKFCKDYRDFKAYNENKQMRCLLMCYKSLCEHLRCSAVFNNLSEHKVGQCNNTAVPSVVLPQMSMQELIVEGAGYDDIINAFNYELGPAKQIIVPPSKQTHMPALVTPLTSIAAATPLAPIQHTIKTSGLQHTASKASTPPTCVTGANSAPISAHGPKVKIENSSHQLFKHQSSAATPISNMCGIEHQSQVNTVVSTHPPLIQLNQLKNSGNITYIGPNTRGIVVPIVSSSGSTAVPLSIASARIQTLNRQLAQARALAVSSCSTSISNTSSTTANSKMVSNESRNPLSTFKVSLASTQPLKAISTFSCTPPNAPVSSSVSGTAQVRNPPPIKTVSNGSAMYSVLYTGIGNKITIKRKTDGDEDAAQKKNSSTSTSNPNLLRSLQKTPSKKRGCRCGNTTATPGKLTCCGQRCPCYVDSKSCIGCKCRGCRNPHRPDGNKVRPIIPELACYEIQMADELGNINELPITSNALNAFGTDMNNATTIHASSLTMNSNTTTTTVVTASTSANAALIPMKTLHTFTTSPLNVTSTMPPLTSTTMSTHTSSMTQASFGHTSTSLSSIPVPTSSASSNLTGPGSIVQLDQIQRESLLIQNVEGKFQVVNVYTTGGGGNNGVCNTQSSNQLSSFRGIQAMPTNVASTQNNFIIPTSVSSSPMSGTTTTTSLPQLLLQSQQQQHSTQHILQQSQHQQQQPQQLSHQTLLSQRIPNNVNTTSLPLQLQQQLKQNIITVHTIHTNPSTNTSPITAPVLTPSSSPAPTSATINLPPLIPNNPHSQSTSCLELTSSSDVSRNSFTNILVSSSASANTPSASASITSIPLSASLAATVQSQSLSRKSLHSPNI